MYRRFLCILVVCLAFFVTVFSGGANAWNYIQSAATEPQDDLIAPGSAQARPPAPATPVVKGKPITKVKPAAEVTTRILYDPALFQHLYPQVPTCVLPVTRPKGWELDAEVLFARVRGKLRYGSGWWGGAWGWWGVYGFNRDIDMNADLMVPDHQAVATYSAAYRFRPNWAFRYSATPMSIENSGQPTNWWFAGYGIRTKWEWLYQRMGIVYEPVRTHVTRIGIFGDYVRVNDRRSVYQIGCCGQSVDNDVNMAMAGIELERCLKTTRTCSTLSLTCKAGVAFLDDAVGADVSGGLKYSIPLNSGRWGYVKGGYRYLTYKKNVSDARGFDTNLEGGFVQAGFVF